MESTTTRRAALGILATGPVALLPALTVMSCSEKAEAAPISRWDIAYRRFKPIWEEWARGYDEAEAMPAGPCQEAAFNAFYAKVPEYQRERDRFMEVPAPTLAALAHKMRVFEIADSGIGQAKALRPGGLRT